MAGSFGRDDSVLKDKGGHRGASPQQRAAAAGTKAKPQREGRSIFDILYNDRFDLSTDGPDVGRFLRGSYKQQYVEFDNEGNPLEVDEDEEGRPLIVTDTLPYLSAFVEHRSQKTKQTIHCSGGPFAHDSVPWKYRELRDLCLGCDEYQAGWDRLREEFGKKIPPGKVPLIGRYQKCVLSFLRYGTHHNVKVTDRSGNVRHSKKTGEAYMKWAPCPKIYGAKSCSACRDKAPSKLGHVLHYSLPVTPWQYLTGYSDQVLAPICKNCGKGKVETAAWFCRNCDEAVIDMSDTELDANELKQETRRPTRCPHCDKTGYLKAAMECSKCDDPEPASFFDCDLHLLGIPSGLSTNLQITDHGPIGPIPKEYREMAKPMDLSVIFAPTAVEYQAQVLGLADPEADKPKSRAYEKKKAKTPKEEVEEEVDEEDGNDEDEKAESDLDF